MYALRIVTTINLAGRHGSLCGSLRLNSTKNLLIKGLTTTAVINVGRDSLQAGLLFTDN